MIASVTSIIVPVYNVRGYLERTIQSIVDQSDPDWELILVDDGSTDGSSELCDDYAEKDSRIRVFHKVNSGASDARNMGIDRARGDTIVFVDADDYMASEALSVLKMTMSSEIDMVVCDFTHINSDSVFMPRGDYEVNTLTDSEALEDMLYQRFITNSPWAKLYRTSIFKGIRFPSGKINQDLGTTYKLIAASRKIATINRSMYAYVFRPDSVINAKFTDKRMAGLEFAYEQYEFIKDKYPALTDAAANRLFMEADSIIRKMGFFAPFAHKDNYRKCKIAIEFTRHTVLSDPNSSKKHVILATLSRISPYLLSISGFILGIRQILKVRFNR